MNIRLSGIKKSFGLKNVLNGISVEFRQGAIHALLGENGAGKSTLAAIISGELNYDEGGIFIDDKETFIKNTAEAVSLGITKISQTPILAEGISILRNFSIGRKSVDKQLLKELAANWCPELDLKKKVFDAGADERFFASLIDALLSKPKVLILDEPGSRLDWHQRRALYSSLRNLADGGTNIIMITHSMTEAEFYTDTITVLENGIISAHYDDSRDFDRHSFRFAEDSIFVPHKDSSTAEDFLIKYSGLSCTPRTKAGIKDCSFEIQKGKITLVSGSSESGLDTLENIVTGMERTRIHGKACYRHRQKDRTVIGNLYKKPFSAKDIRNLFSANSTGILPSDKINRGSFPELTVEQAAVQNIKSGSAYNAAQSLIKKAGINTRPQDKVRTLSGGMLQKLIIERELYNNPDLMIFCEPMQGLDSHSAGIFCRRLKSLSEEGKTILVLSSTEFPAEYADNIYILKNGTLERTSEKKTERITGKNR